MPYDEAARAADKDKRAKTVMDAIRKLEDKKTERTRIIEDMTLGLQAQKAQTMAKIRAEEQAQQTQGGGGGFSTGAAFPSSVQGAKSVGVEANRAESEFLREQETGTKDTIIPGTASGGGLPPREITTNRETTRERTIGSRGGFMDFLRLFNPEIGVSQTTIPSSTTSRNPDYDEAIERRSASVASSLHSAQLGRTSPEEVATYTEQQLGALPPEDRALANAKVKRYLQDLKVQQGEVDTVQALEISSMLAKDGVLSPGLVQLGAKAETPEQVEEYNLALQKAYRNSPKEVRARRIQEIQLGTAELNQKIAQNKYDDDNAARAANEIADERRGVFVTNGAHTTLTEKQITDGQDKSWYRKTEGGKKLNLQEEKYPTYRKWIEGEIANWQTVNYPLYKGDYGGLATGDTYEAKDPDGNTYDDMDNHWKKSRGKVFSIEPNDVYTHILTVERLSFDKNGKIAENEADIDFKKTEAIHRQSYDWLNLNGYDAEPGQDGRALVAVHPDFPHPVQAGKILNISRSTINAGDRRGAVILTPNNQRGTDLEATRLPPKQLAPITPEFAAGISMANRAENERKFRESVTRGTGRGARVFPGQVGFDPPTAGPVQGPELPPQEPVQGPEVPPLPDPRARLEVRYSKLRERYPGVYNYKELMELERERVRQARLRPDRFGGTP